VFGRRTSSDRDSTQSDADAAVEQGSTPGKGHATPKRKEAEAARKKRLTPPKTRKESAALRKERMREQRSKQRIALSGGDDRYLPARDQGPVKKYARDYVDSRRTIGEFLIPIFIAVLLLGIVMANIAPTSTFAASGTWIVVLILVVVDSLRILRGVKSGITERFGADETKGISFYTLMRSWQMRRLRLPKPQVGHGAAI
jgi:DUF3043 family protein